MPAKIQSNFATINKTTLHYLSAGTGKLLLFLHGFPLCSKMWEKQLLFFCENYHAVALDLPGFYLSNNAKKIELHDVIEKISVFIHYLGYENAIIIGHDIGGFIATEIATHHPTYIEKLILISALPAHLVETTLSLYQKYEKIYSYMNYLADPRAEEKLKKNDYHYFWKFLMPELIENSIISSEEKRFYESTWKQKDTLKSMLAYYQNNIFKNASAHYSSILTKTLIILGEGDLLFPTEMLEKIKFYFPYHVLWIMKKNAHWLTYTNTEEINQIITDFLTKDIRLLPKQGPTAKKIGLN